ncbi:MAG: TolC family protein [Burkholderiales bacterium]|nr:TolC family protein [Burkholderiales bacterium]
MGYRLLCAAIALACVAGCGRQAYREQPLDSEAGERAYRARTLSSGELHDYFVAQSHAVTPWPLAKWDLPALTLAAVLYHPEIELARAKARVSTAETQTSRTRQPISINARPEYNSKAGEGETPWGMGVLVGLPIDIGDKRGKRTEQLTRLEDAANLEVGVATWRVRSRLRRHFVELYVADRTYAALEREQQERRQLVTLMEKREAKGYASATDVSTLRLRMAETEVLLRRAAVRRDQALAGVAEAVSVPLAEMMRVRFDFSALEKPMAPPSAAEASRAALLNRIDLRRKLADYAAAEAAVKLEVARQYPDITLFPGYFWDADESIWSIAFVGLLPPGARTKALIRETEARREVEQKAFLALQTAVIAEADAAASRYRLAWEAEHAARSQIEEALARRARAERQFERGYADRVELVQARLEAVASERTAVVAMLETQQGLSALEDALQRPLDNPEFVTTPQAASTPSQSVPNPALIDND